MATCSGPARTRMERQALLGGGLGGGAVLAVLDVPQREVLVAIAHGLAEIAARLRFGRWVVGERLLAVEDRRIEQRPGLVPVALEVPDQDQRGVVAQPHV